MVNKKLRRLILYDLKRGVSENKFKFLISFIFFILLCGEYFTFYSKINNITCKPTSMDYMIYLFKGLKVYKPSLKTIFEVPIGWIVMNLMAAFLVAYYPVSELFVNDCQTIIRTNKSIYYWISKCVWVICNITLFYICCFIAVQLFIVVTKGNLSMVPTQELNKRISSLDVIGINQFELIIAIWVLPFATTVLISLIQMLVSFMLSPVYSLIAVISLLIISVYYYTPYLIGNYLIFYRNSMVYQGGYNTYWALTFDIVLCVVVMILGGIYFKNLDFIHKNKENE